MSTASSDSSMEIGPDSVPLMDASSAEGAVWLSGDVLACACPDCGAPMSVRLWLMVADCFRCGTSIELSEDQEREALRLLREQEDERRADSRQAVAAISPTMLRKPKPRPAETPQPPAESQPATEPEPSVPSQPSRVPVAVPVERRRRVAASQTHRGARAHIRKIHEKGGVAIFWGELLRDLPAWLISLVLHLVAMLLLGLWYENVDDSSQSITLSTSVSYEDLEGELDEIDPMPQAFEFEDPGAVELQNVVQQAGTPTEQRVELEPVDVPLEVPDPLGNLSDRAVRTPLPISRAPAGRMFAGRDPQARAQIVEQSGGTSYTEAAVARGLKFLARHQNQDGSWSLHAFGKTPDCDATCRGHGSARSDVAGTALSLLPFLGAGETHLQGQYTGEILRGLNWLVEHQGEDGGMIDGGQMYGHGQATIVLCEAFALSGDEQLRGPAQLALNYIVRAQHKQGGWRYRPGEAGDTSVVGWQLMALKSGQMGYLHVPRKTFELAGLFLDRVQADRYGGQYGYQSGRSPTAAMTAEALLCRQYLGWPKNHQGLQAGVDFLLQKHLPDRKKPNIYYWYYATQVMHHYGGEPWETWNAKMRQVLVDMQQTHGHAAGSWDPQGRGNSGGHADRGGRIFMTGLAICILEVYYRHMPIYSEEVLEGFE